MVPALAAGKWQSQINIDGKMVPYEFDVEQFFQNIDGSARAGGASGEIRGKMTGEQIRFALAAKGGKIDRHEFQGVLKGDTITGTVKIGLDTVTRPWSAKLVKRGELMRAQDEPEAK